MSVRRVYSLNDVGLGYSVFFSFLQTSAGELYFPESANTKCFAKNGRTSV
jgi:hypothetical protein